MSLKRPTKALQVRLGFIVTLTAMGAFLLAFGALQFSIWKGFRNQERLELDSRLLAYWAVWQSDGNQAVLDSALAEAEIQGGRPFLFILEDAEARVLGAVIPGGWEQFDLNNPMIRNLGPGRYMTLRSDARSYSLILTGSVLEDGSYLLVGINTESRQFLLGVYKRNAPWALAAMVLAGFLVGVLGTRRLVSPLNRLNKEIDRIILTGAFSRRLVSPETGDQLDGLISRFNRLLERVEILINGMRDTLDAVAHDLRTPLTRLRGHAELALRGGENPTSLREALVEAVEQTDQAAGLLSALMDIAEAERGLLPLEGTSCDLAELAGEVAELYRFIAEERNVEFVTRFTGPAPLKGDPVRIRQILGNLLDNAFKYGPRGGRVDFRVDGDADRLRVAVIDDGPGVPEGERERVFDRLYRGDLSRGSRGLGLGLSLVKALVQAHEGRVFITDEEGRGAEFRVEFSKITNL